MNYLVQILRDSLRLLAQIFAKNLIYYTAHKHMRGASYTSVVMTLEVIDEMVQLEYRTASFRFLLVPKSFPTFGATFYSEINDKLNERRSRSDYAMSVGMKYRGSFLTSLCRSNAVRFRQISIIASNLIAAFHRLIDHHKLDDRGTDQPLGWVMSKLIRLQLLCVLLASLPFWIWSIVQSASIIGYLLTRDPSWIDYRSDSFHSLDMLH